MLTTGISTVEWLDIRQLTQYAAVSERTLRAWIHAATNPLPASRVGNKILVRKRDFDSYLENHRIQASESLDRIVTEIVAEVSA